MILLEVGNRILKETIDKAIASQRREALDVTLCDFDGVQYHVSTPDPNCRNVVAVSIQWRCVPELLSHGGQNDVNKIYGSLVQATAEASYDLTLQFDLDNLGEEADKLSAKISLLRRHLISAPFKKTFIEVEAGKAGNDIITLNYRDEETIYIKPEGERVIVIFNVFFSDADDQVLGKVFLQEYADARRTMSNAPSVTFTQRGEVPLELQGVPGITGDERTGFVSFVLFQSHINQRNAIKTINTIQLFRDYLHYHIKCAKGHLHTRMRNRVQLLLQVLNRARPEVKKEKKKMSGKTFVRK
eukprot:TRINITY_DN16892_c0_g1_i1.p2 TRINITY_DN16892_c0_g1~~TRINITY_DN16892_c0_g1_i1.p2  ORF type:complete len:309 (+),score=104.15 TRINITY_DN16892_c0_g1_i1:28-927(+)